MPKTLGESSLHIKATAQSCLALLAMKVELLKFCAGIFHLIVLKHIPQTNFPSEASQFWESISQ